MLANLHLKLKTLHMYCNISDMDWNALGPSIIGGLITGFFALCAVYLTYRWNKKNETDNKNKEIEALIQSIKDEIETIREIYMKRVGDDLERNGGKGAFQNYFWVKQEYFTVYSSNADKIGMIENDELRQSIVKTYVYAKSLVETYNVNNNIFQEYENNLRKFQIEDNSTYKEHADQDLAAMKVYAEGLFSVHEEFLKSSEDLLENIKKYQI